MQIANLLLKLILKQVKYHFLHLHMLVLKSRESNYGFRIYKLPANIIC